MPSYEERQARNRNRAWAVGGVWGAATLVACMIAFVSVFLADAPGYPDKRGLEVCVYACFALPLTTLGALVGGVTSALLGRTRWILATSLLPVVTFAIAVQGYITYVNQPRTF